MRIIREGDSKYRFRAVIKADSRDLAVDAGDEMRETRIALARGIVGGEIWWARSVVGCNKFAYKVGGRWISPGFAKDAA
jgi:hypothetical protein